MCDSKKANCSAKQMPSTACDGSVAPCDATPPMLPAEQCWIADYDKKISGEAYGRYFKKYKADGTEYSSMPPKYGGKIYAPLKSSTKVTWEVRFKAEAQTGVTDADVTTAKTKLENGVSTHWNGKFTLEADDPVCGKKSFSVEYKIVWVTSGEDYIIKIHDTYAREGVTGTVMDVSKSTSDWTYAHEFAHCIGLPDEYSYVSGSTEKVRHINSDCSLGPEISAPFDGKPNTAADASIMSAVNNTTTLSHHGWNVAIEVQDLLTEKLGRSIKCTIK
jgi:hypothetical protein